MKLSEMVPTLCTNLEPGDRVMCLYACNTQMLDLYDIYTVEYALRNASGLFVALIGIPMAFPRWRFIRVNPA